jgi:hypothetical protein
VIKASRLSSALVLAEADQLKVRIEMGRRSEQGTVFNQVWHSKIKVVPE